MALKILLITDHTSSSATLARPLLAAGHAPTQVPEGSAPLRLIHQEKPDLLIVAVAAEKAAALACEHRLHGPDGTRVVPVIVVSECLRLEGELAHIFDFIPLPLDETRLLEAVAAVAARPARTDKQILLSDHQFQQFSTHILSRTGLQFEARNRSSLERAVNKRMSALRFDSCADYLAFLMRHGEDRYELQKLLQFLTVGETYFFRYPSHFDALREHLAKTAFSRQPIRIWSAGCSSGEEPYSIAITLMQALPDWKERDIRIIATDINRHSIARAREGRYSPWSLRATDRWHLERYFEEVDGSLAVRDEVKRLVEFHPLNLTATCSGDFCNELRDLDAIFCRNVLIYFSPDTASGIVRKLSGALKPGGQLFLGHAESQFQRGTDLEARRRDDSFHYVKNQAPAAVSLPEPLPEQRNVRSIASTMALPKPEPDSADSLEAARRLFETEHLDEALELLQKVLRKFPMQTGALVLQGFVLAAKGRLEEALDSCRRAIAINDLLPEAYFLKGIVLDAGGRLAEAADEYRKALLLDHNFIMPRYHMGRLHLKLGRVPEAAREIRNSIRILTGNRDEEVPYSGGLSRSVCLQQLKNVLAQVA